MVQLGRRTVLGSAVAIGAAPALVASRFPHSPPSLIRSRVGLSHGVRTGDVTTDGAVLWARSDAEGRLMVSLESNGRRLRSIRGPWAAPDTDHTARVVLQGLAPGREYAARMWFARPDGQPGQVATARFRTAPVHAAATSFVWSGDTCGQGWGINPDLGGMTGYRTVHELRPDFFLHCGDNIYADIPMAEQTTDLTGTPWRNELTEAVTRVAQTLEDFRGRHRYVIEDHNVRELYADVPTIAMWDDHETLNNWYPGEIVDDPAYTEERRCDVLARRGRQAWQEYQPIAPVHLLRAGDDGFASARIYRKIARGAHLDVFCLDMRSYRGPNGHNLDRVGTGILGPTQADWLIDEVSRSRATWKVIAADMPLSAVAGGDDDRDSVANDAPGAPLGREQEIARILSAFKRNEVRNVIWLTADVHYTAAHHYHPERAAYDDFDPFWEFISGPIAAGTFNVKQPDPTFGPELVYAKGNPRTADQMLMSPASGNQFAGQVEIDAAGRLTITLHSTGEGPLWRRTFEPDESATGSAGNVARSAV